MRGLLSEAKQKSIREERRDLILKSLMESTTPITGADLSAKNKCKSTSYCW
ncbi:hypothetical protein KHA80_04740 [Anaerobacillus sp. HL2]|nr:hypothetical protein KHA80_04740 [Anaerobacillus sp. HL2]